MDRDAWARLARRAWWAMLLGAALLALALAVGDPRPGWVTMIGAVGGLVMAGAFWAWLLAAGRAWQDDRKRPHP